VPRFAVVVSLAAAEALFCRPPPGHDPRLLAHADGDPGHAPTRMVGLLQTLRCLAGTLLAGAWHRSALTKG
jgi:hypothetical protein